MAKIEIELDDDGYEDQIVGRWVGYTLYDDDGAELLFRHRDYETKQGEYEKRAQDQIHTVLAQALNSAEPYAHTVNCDDNHTAITLTHCWNSENLSVSVVFGEEYEASAVRLEYPLMDLYPLPRSMDHSGIMEAMTQEFEKIINTVDLDWVFSDRILENWSDLEVSAGLFLDRNVWHDRWGEMDDFKYGDHLELIREREKQWGEIADTIKENQLCYLPHPAMIDSETLEPKMELWNWWDGNVITAPRHGESGICRFSDAKAAQVLALFEYVEKHYGAIAIPAADQRAARRVAERGVYYTLLSECDAEQLSRRDGYLFELQMVADAEYYSEVA